MAVIQIHDGSQPRCCATCALHYMVKPNMFSRAYTFCPVQGGTLPRPLTAHVCAAWVQEQYEQTTVELYKELAKVRSVQ